MYIDYIKRSSQWALAGARSLLASYNLLVGGPLVLGSFPLDGNAGHGLAVLGVGLEGVPASAFGGLLFLRLLLHVLCVLDLLLYLRDQGLELGDLLLGILGLFLLLVADPLLDDGDGALKAGHGLVELAVVSEGDAKLVMRLGGASGDINIRTTCKTKYS